MTVYVYMCACKQKFRPEVKVERSVCFPQVEHPCTEMVADVNLPALQLQVSHFVVISLHGDDIVAW